MPRPGSPKPSYPPKGKSSGRPGAPSSGRPHVLNDSQINHLINTTSEDVLVQKATTEIDHQLLQSADEFSDLIDAAYPSEAKVADPIAASVDADINSDINADIPSTLGEVTLNMLDAGLDLYLKALDHQSTCKNGSTAYWDAQKDISKRNALQINLGQRWRAQQDRLMREALDQNTTEMRITRAQVRN